nr:glycoside hydrolase family 20 zincin-like fold domain-containing protein [Fodinicola feengrottensis]
MLNSADNGQLQTAAEVLATDLGRLLGRTVEIVTGTPAAGDLQMTFTGSATGLDAEAYELRVGSTIEVRGPKSGAFWGTRTLVQWFRQSRTIPGGIAQDRPKYADRGLLVANVAKYFTMTWWQGQIEELSYLKMNLLWLSVGYDSTPLADMQAIAQYAARHNVTMVPLFNMPGHMDKPLTGHPDMQLPGVPANLDLSKDAAYPFAAGLLTRCLALSTRRTGTPARTNTWATTPRFRSLVRTRGHITDQPRCRRTASTVFSTTSTRLSAPPARPCASGTTAFSPAEPSPSTRMSSSSTGFPIPPTKHRSNWSTRATTYRTRIRISFTMTRETGTRIRSESTTTSTSACSTTA